MTTSTLDARSDVINGLTRQRFLGSVSLVALLTACGSESASGPSTTANAVQDSGFPVTVDHKYGSTTIPAEPQRVVTVGFTDPDFVLADKVLVGALAFGSVLSLPYELDRIVPMLAAALDGDPVPVPVS